MSDDTTSIPNTDLEALGKSRHDDLVPWQAHLEYVDAVLAHYKPKPPPTLTERLRDIAHDGITRDGKGRGCADAVLMAADRLEHLERLIPLYEAVVEAADALRERSPVWPVYDEACDALRAAKEATP